MSGLLPLEEALDRMVAAVAPLTPRRLPLLACDGLVLAETVLALRTQPPFDVSAMDGYALPAPPRPGDRYTVTGEVPAGGHFAGSIGPGEAVRIFTGAPVPAGGTHVLIQEDAVRDGATLTVGHKVEDGANIRPAGGDFAAGHPVLPAGTRLTPQDVALAAAADHPDLLVHPAPTVTIIMNGDELRWPGHRDPVVATETEHGSASRTAMADATDQAIVASNGFGVAALVRRLGGHGEAVRLVPDDMGQLSEAIEQSASDLLVTIGGTSVGDHDLVRPALETAGYALSFPKVALKPGKPTVFGTLASDGRQRIVLGLPGNPVSAMVAGLIFLRPLITALAARPHEPRLPLGTATAAAPLPANGPRAHFMRATGSDEVGYTPVKSQDSSLLHLLSGATALIYRPAHASALSAGAPCQVLPLPR